MRLIVGISGASGVIYGIRMLEVLKDQPDVETHLVISNGGKLNIALETDWDVKDVEALADEVHSDQNLAATIASGSFKTGGMVIAPCSMKTLSGVVNSYADTLVVRAADVILKEHRPMVLMPRETPLHAGHCFMQQRANQQPSHGKADQMHRLMRRGGGVNLLGQLRRQRLNVMLNRRIIQIQRCKTALLQMLLQLVHAAAGAQNAMQQHHQFFIFFCLSHADSPLPCKNTSQGRW